MALTYNLHQDGNLTVEGTLENGDKVKSTVQSPVVRKLSEAEYNREVERQAKERQAAIDDSIKAAQEAAKKSVEREAAIDKLLASA